MASGTGHHQFEYLYVCMYGEFVHVTSSPGLAAIDEETSMNPHSIGE